MRRPTTSRLTRVAVPQRTAHWPSKPPPSRDSGRVPSPSSKTASQSTLATNHAPDHIRELGADNAPYRPHHASRLIMRHKSGTLGAAGGSCLGGISPMVATAAAPVFGPPPLPRTRLIGREAER